MEKRLAKRYDIPLRALMYQRDDHPQTLKIRNISAGGLLCGIGIPIPEGTDVFISLFMNAVPNKQNHERNVVKVKGKICRRSESEVAVSFDRPYQFAWM